MSENTYGICCGFCGRPLEKNTVRVFQFHDVKGHFCSQDHMERFKGGEKYSGPDWDVAYYGDEELEEDLLPEDELEDDEYDEDEYEDDEED